MFFGCISLKDIKPLENWIISKGIYFSRMFYDCLSLNDIKPLENWNVSKGIYFILQVCSKVVHHYTILNH